MAVPTIYSKLIEHYNQRLNRGRGTKRAKDFIRAVCTSKIRCVYSPLLKIYRYLVKFEFIVLVCDLYQTNDYDS